MNPLLTIIIVHYKTPGLLADCLGSLYARPWGISFETIVADNASGDDSRERIMGAFPQVKWIDMGYNAGFARANNAGIRQSAGDAVLLLNPDTLVEDDAIEQCCRRLMASPYVACGVQLLNADRTWQSSGSYFVKGGLNTLLPVPYLGALVRSLGYRLNAKKTMLPEEVGTVEVDWVNGAFLMVKKSVMEKAGLLDEDFFLYSEEIEWCGRLRRQGPLCIYGDLRVLHLEGQSTNTAFNSGGKGYYNLFDRKGRQLMLSGFVRVRKQFGKRWFLFGLLFYLLGIPVFLGGWLLSKLFRGSRARFSFAQFRGYCANVFFIVSKAGIILRNRPHFYKVL